MQCKVDGCDHEAHYKAAALCQMHYFRLWRYGTTDTVRRGKVKPRQENPQGYQWVHAPGHPLAHRNGYVAEHRAVLYADLGDGPLACELCGVSLEWATCHVDHIDTDVRNNVRGNLRPTCQTCNTRRGRKPESTYSPFPIEYGGLTLTAAEWARDPRVNLSGAAIRNRIKAGMTPGQALFGAKATHNGNAYVNGRTRAELKAQRSEKEYGSDGNTGTTGHRGALRERLQRIQPEGGGREGRKRRRDDRGRLERQPRRDGAAQASF